MSIVLTFCRSIACRLYAIGALTLLAVSVIAGVSASYAVLAGRSTQSVYRLGVGGVLEARQLELLLERHRRVIETALHPLDRPADPSTLRTAEQIVTELRLALRRDDPLTVKIGPELLELLRAGESVLRPTEEKARGRAIDRVAHYGELADQLLGEIEAYRAEQVAAADNAMAALEARGQLLMHVLSSLLGFVFLVLAPLGLYVIRNTALRVQDTSRAMISLAQDSTSVELNPGADRDELAIMMRAVEVFKANAVMLLEQKGRLEQVNFWLDIALNNMSRGLSMYDANQQLVVCNANYARLYQLPPDLIRPGTPFEQVIEYRKKLVARVGNDPLDSNNLNAAERVRVIAKISEDTRSSLTMKNGTVIEVTTRPLSAGGWVALHEDVTERRRIADRMVHLARHDTMTGLVNRHHFRSLLDRALGPESDSEPLALLCIDLDRFKQVNDSLGHPIGDLLLQQVAARLSGAVRHGDIVARLGGDEFAVLQRNVRQSSDAATLARRVVDVLSAPYQIQSHRIDIGATIGIAISGDQARCAETLMKCADLALYRGKTGGRGQYVDFEPSMEGELRARVRLERDLQRAVEEEQFELHYQPIVSLSSGYVMGCEALIRWRHPERGMVSPAEFIPAAEDMGLIAAIGAIAMRAACKEAAAWPGDVAVSVNLSAAQFGACDLTGLVSSALKESGLAAQRLVLEVTESVILDDDPETVEVLHDLRSLGVKIALDDFGTGYSSLSYLKSFPFDKLKIDQSFVKELSQRADCEAIVSAIAQLARSLSMETVAEGVETEDHLAKVRAAGCTDAQGYLFSRPVPQADVLAAIEACHRKVARLNVAA